MGCLGVHFAITTQEAEHLRGLASNADRLAYVQEVLEPHYFEKSPDFKAENDKAWDAIHRALTDGLLHSDGGDYPLNHVVLGGERLYGEEDYIMSLKSPEQVREISRALECMTESEFRGHYDRIDADDYPQPLDDDDFQYTWSWFQGVRDLYACAAANRRYVLFTADQ